jgi:hypothetical protein
MRPAPLGKRRLGSARVSDSSAEGRREKRDFAPRITRLNPRLGHVEAQATQLAEEATRQVDLRLIIGRLTELVATAHACGGWQSNPQTGGEPAPPTCNRPSSSTAPR